MLIKYLIGISLPSKQRYHFHSQFHELWNKVSENSVEKRRARLDTDGPLPL